MDRVALVTFFAGPHRFALEASQVLRLTPHGEGERQVAAAHLLCPEAAGNAPTRWLTLMDAQGAWQLGVEGNVELLEWTAQTLHPLPALIQARRSIPALCGLAIEDQRAGLWLLQASWLSPDRSGGKPKTR
ncbi:hypothetical protein [Vreelandella sp. EE22]